MAAQVSSDLDAKVNQDVQENDQKARVSRQKKTSGPVSILQLNIFILVMVLVTSGLVPLEDLGFVAFASVYFVVMAKLVFPSPIVDAQPRIFAGNRLLGRYVASAGVIGLLLPIAYVLGSFVQGDRKALKSASPHLFLLACQVLTEIISAKGKGTSLPVRALIPIFYNTRRLFSIASWIRSDFARGEHRVEGSMGMSHWNLFGRGLAAANMAVWTFNLFCFLLPIYLPRIMRIHYEQERASKEHRS